MTKEELKQEAEDKYNERLRQNGYKVDYKNETYIDGYVDSAEPREKEIKSLGERCLQLQKDKGNLTDRVNDLEEKLANADYQLEGRDLEIKEPKAQIEEMKCCFNCKHSRTEYEHCKTDKHEKWEIKEND
jgi:chromosome segregation ATPase